MSFKDSTTSKKIVSSIILQCPFKSSSVIGMRLHRFYVSQPLGEEVVIADVSLIKQWIKVFRYKKADFVILFNGEGEDVTYSIETITLASLTLVKTKSSPSYIPETKVTLYLSVIKKDNFELALQKVTELGVTHVVPIISEHSEKKGLNQERLNKIAHEASEQCGRGDVPTISEITTLDAVLGSPRSHDLTLVLQMGGISFPELMNSASFVHKKSIALFVGPEGGWSSEEERKFKDNTIQTLSLGHTVLRAETATIVGCSLFFIHTN